MFLRKLPLPLLWGCFFYLIFIIQALLIYFIDMSSIGNINKWRFVEPSYLTAIYFFLSLMGFFIFHMFILLVKQKFNKTPSLFYFYNPTNFAKIIFYIVLIAYVLLSLFVFSDNYRKDSNALSMIIMTPLNTLLWSFILIFIFQLKDNMNRYSYLIIPGLFGLLINLSGVGSFTTLLAITLIYILINTNITPKSLILFILIGLFSSFLILLYVLITKYGFVISDLKIEDFYTLLGWVVQRILTVPGSSIFLIENYFSDIYYFNILSSYEILISNFSKIFNFGHYESEFTALGAYNYSLFYSGSGTVIAGTSPGLLGGAVFFIPWPVAAFFSGCILYVILYLSASSWGLYISSTSTVIKFLFFYFVINYFLLNPYAWFSILDPGLIKFIVFLLAPKIFYNLNRIKIYL